MADFTAAARAPCGHEFAVNLRRGFFYFAAIFSRAL